MAECGKLPFQLGLGELSGGVHGVDHDVVDQDALAGGDVDLDVPQRIAHLGDPLVGATGALGDAVDQRSRQRQLDVHPSAAVAIGIEIPGRAAVGFAIDVEALQ